MDKIQIQGVVCKKPFAPKTANPIYCSKNCSDAAYSNKKTLQKQEEQRKIVADTISDNRIYIFRNSSNNSLLNRKRALYRLIRQRRIPANNPVLS
jgi:hypothetical protein